MRTRSLIPFFVASMALLVGWQFFMNWMWPPKPRAAKPRGEAISLPDPRMWANLPAAVPPVLALPGAGVSGPVQLAVEAGVLSNRVASQGRPTAVAKKEEAPPKPIVRKKTEEIRIGDDSFNLKGTLTTRGAGVQNLTLTAFAEATSEGLPMDPPQLLELIPNNPRAPSNTLYHYAEGSDNRPDRPEGDLGELEWEVKSRQNGDGQAAHEVVFTADVPKQDVRLTKTYTLGRGDYHLGLTIRMEKKGDSAQPTRFRYQLMGAHGLPIEGVWYTTARHMARFATEPEDRISSRRPRGVAGGRQVHSLCRGGYPILRLHDCR
jgi:YidC/Oxa1 family membrane protein insertase